MSYLATTEQDEKSCASFWGKLVAKLENCDTKSGRECHMIHKIMGLKCSEISEVGEYYSETLKVINSLTCDNPSLVQNDTFLRVVFHMNIHVEELKKETTSLLSVFSKTALVILDKMDKVHSSWKLSGNIKGNLPGQTTKLLQLAGRKSESTPVKKVKPEKSFASFPANHCIAIPRVLYEVLKSWYETAIVFCSNEDSQVNLMRTFKKKIAKAILPEHTSRDTNWKQSKEYNATNKKMNTTNTKLRRAEAMLADMGVCACSRSRSRSRSCSGSRSPSSTGHSARRRSCYSPSSSREHSSRDRGREHFRAHAVRRTDQFALNLNSGASEYRNVSKARQGRRE